ncbi:transposase-like protein [Mucilaginibacter rubeus]|uniref:helix-turn-helix domain-containing protein n=1 Tax=Mucilaginibacter rubeus TaxID=2027860 RepID=UPI00339293DE
MEKHSGQIVELRIRRSGYNLSDLARLMNVNRRTLYSWFTKRGLERDIILKIGLAIRHDFSKEFPELFTGAEFKQNNSSSVVKLISKKFDVSKRILDKHYGQILELTIRKRGYSISEISKLLNVNRRSVYNWFNQSQLKAEIIYNVGLAIKHDFSIEFPEFFEKEDFLHQFNDINVASDLMSPADEVKNAPLSFIFNKEDFSKNDIKQIVGLLSDLYADIGGDYLKISGLSQFELLLNLA